MSFYTEPAFFVILAVACIPAIVLGLLEKPLKHYGLVASVVFLALLFGRDLEGLAAFGVFLVIALATTFFTLRCFQREDKHAVGKYRVALALMLVPIVCAKVSAVFDANLLGFIGISYLTFKAVQVLIEIRDGLIKELGFFDYLYFLVFFTPFTSGPIARSRDFVAQANAKMTRAEYCDLLSAGLLKFLLGAVYSFLLAGFFQWAMWFAPSAIGSATAGAAVGAELAEAFLYGMYLFFDFAGYSLMAIGAGCVFGIRLPDNFNMPFLATTIQDFWDRWHISLSHWLRDYVFMRVSRVFLKKKVFKSRVTTACIGFMCNMTLMGFWHGITPNYIAYGLYHGILLALTDAFQKSSFYKRNKDKTAFKICSWFVTLNLVMFGFALFSGQIVL